MRVLTIFLLFICMSIFFACKQENTATETTEPATMTEVKTDTMPMADTTASDTMMINETRPVSRPN